MLLSPRLASLVAGTACAVLSFIAVRAAPPPRPWPPDQFTPLSARRIAALPAGERAAWQVYWDASEKLAGTRPVPQAPEAPPLEPRPLPPKGGLHTRGLRLNEPAAWYAGAVARTTADRVVAAQMPLGAWPKGNDYTRPAAAAAPGGHGWSSGTFDNDATIYELRFLARVISAVGENESPAAWRDAFARGLRYVFAAQYPNGGFPQIYPLVGGYHDGVTFNDDAMTHVLELLGDVAAGKNEYAFNPAATRAEAAARLARGLDCVLATQLRDADGRPTVWCQQYDPLTLRAAAARNFEPVADCSRESAAIVVFLMSRPDRPPEIAAAVEGAIAWFRATARHDLKVAGAPADGRGDVVPAPGAPPLWARFYEPGTTTPIFGDRDRTIHYVLAEVSPERIAGYTWYTGAPAEALAAFARWRTAAPPPAATNR